MEGPSPVQSHCCAFMYSSTCKHGWRASPGPGSQDLPGEDMCAYLEYMTLCTCLCQDLQTLVSMSCAMTLHVHVSTFVCVVCASGDSPSIWVILWKLRETFLF